MVQAGGLITYVQEMVQQCVGVLTAWSSLLNEPFL